VRCEAATAVAGHAVEAPLPSLDARLRTPSLVPGPQRAPNDEPFRGSDDSVERSGCGKVGET